MVCRDIAAGDPLGQGSVELDAQMDLEKKGSHVIS
jgi:hypothetical protein